MLQYHLSIPKPHTHYIDITFIADTQGKAKMQFQHPAWRPGRYELANYAQNIQRWAAYGNDGERLHFRKLTKDLWEVETAGHTQVEIRYTYYANQLDAGASYVDNEQVYINPVNCMVYIPERIDEACQLQVDVPQGYQFAGARKFDEYGRARYTDFHQLADSPFIASPSLKHHLYRVSDYVFHIWIQGEVNPDWDRITEDFKGFTQAQLELFGEMPTREFHFLFQYTPYPMYHGVEHLDSTVIALGPGYRMMEPDMYYSLLGISSHELFHVWNIKSIRPVEMQPYDYSREQYTNLGYVAEGVTTYYGDLMLARGTMGWEGFKRNLDKFLSRYFENEGRKNMTLAYSSWDTWLDGYRPAIPDRRISMYVKGALVALMKDLHIRRQSGNRKSLDDVMRSLYRDFALEGKGYSEEEYLKLIETTAGKLPENFFEDFLFNTKDIEPALEEMLAYVGLRLVPRYAEEPSEDRFGFRYKYENGKCLIAAVAPGSPAENAGLSANDEILGISNWRIENDLREWLLHHKGNISITISRMRKLQTLELKADGGHWFSGHAVEKVVQADREQREAFEKWCGLKW